MVIELNRGRDVRGMWWRSFRPSEAPRFIDQRFTHKCAAHLQVDIGSDRNLASILLILHVEAADKCTMSVFPWDLIVFAAKWKVPRSLSVPPRPHSSSVSLTDVLEFGGSFR
jgi:hypothetical protein